MNLTLDVEHTLPSVEAGPTQLQQVIMNLVINAAEAIPENTFGTVKVSTAYREPSVAERAGAIIPIADDGQKFVALTVTDSGPGIAPEIRSRIFDPFYTTKFAGRGLGLSAVLGIVKSHHGVIALITAPGFGTTFSVLLPPSSAAVLHESPALGEAVRGTGTILVIDDEVAVREMAGRALEQYGYEVLIAENGRQGIDVLATHPEVVGVVLDLAMPVMSGDQAAVELRRLRPTLPIILSSGYSESAARQRFVSTGITSFLQKPYRVATLLEAVRASLSSAGSAER